MIIQKIRAIPAFLMLVLPNITTTFVLVTQITDFPTPRGPAAIKLLDDPRLIRWFTQNPSRFHKKLEPIHIGIA